MTAQPALARIKRRYLEILGLLILALPFATFLFIYQQAGEIIYYKYGAKVWSQPRPGKCSPARQALVYADLRPGQAVAGRNESAQPLELSCEVATSLPATSYYATSADGLQIHYKLYPAAENLPLLLYVPGLTSTWLDGSRFVPLAQRLGFQLAVMEMRNHGISGNDGQGVAYGCREQADVLAVVAALSQSWPQRPLYLWGSSMGSMSILNAAPELQQRFPQWRGVVLENPPSSLRDRLAEASPGYPNFLYDWNLSMASWRAGVDFRACSPLVMAPQLKVPAFVTVSDNDKMTPPEMVRQVYEALPADPRHRYKAYPHGNHAAVWNGQPEEYEADLLAFWQSLP